MFTYAELPDLPPHLWQAAFFMDLTRHFPTFRGSDESRASAARLVRHCPEVSARRRAAARDAAGKSRA